MPKRESCNGCHLINRTEVKFKKGRNTDLLIVGQSPGKVEAEKGEPFVGPSGVLTSEVFEKVGLSKSMFYLANSLRCQEGTPALTGKALSDSLKACRIHLERLIHKYQPKLIVAFGNHAIQTLIKKSKITTKRGQFFISEEFNCVVFPMLHPAAVLRECTKEYPNKSFENMSNREKEFYQDALRLSEYIKNGYKENNELDTTIITATAGNLRSMLEDAKVIALDFETVNTNVHDPNNRVLSVSFSYKEKESIVHVFSPDGGQTASNQEGYLEVTARSIRDVLRSPIPKVVAGRPFDENVARRLLGVEIRNPIHDIFSLAHLVDENYHQFNLENIASLYANMRDIKRHAKGKRNNLTELTREELMTYNGVDSDATLRSFNAIVKRLGLQAPLAEGAQIYRENKLNLYYYGFIHRTETKVSIHNS
jgi:DNA polymerase